MAHNKKLNILQWNSQSAIAKKDNLEHLLYQYDIHIALLSETWFKPGVYVKFSGFDLIRSDRADGRAGVAVLIKSNINYSQVNSLPIIEDVMYVAIKIAAPGNKYLTVVSLYIRPQDTIRCVSYDALFAGLEKPFIVGGDFNSHHHVWGCDTTDNKGRYLLESIEDNNLFILNDGSPTLIPKPGQNKSAIDITVSSHDISHLLEWKIIDDPHSSNHFPILINTFIECNILKLFTHKTWKIGKADWASFTLKTELLNADQETMEYPELIATIDQAAGDSIPKRHHNMQTSNKKTYKPWWNQDCSEVIKKRKTAFTKYKLTPNLLNLITYKNIDANAKKIIKKAKRESWNKFCLSLNKNAPITFLWQQINKYRNYLKPNNRKVIEPQLLERIIDTLCPSWTPVKMPFYPSNIQPSHPLAEPFTYFELRRVLKNNDKSSPGKDNVHYSMIYNLATSAKHTLLNVLNRIWLQEAPIPQDWKDYIVTLIHKSGRDSNSPNSYRPISLASTVLKTFEQLIKLRLEWWLESLDRMPNTQLGFRRNKSTIDSLSLFTCDIQLAFSRNQSVTALFADISKAYDNVLLDRLYIKMKILGIPDKTCCNIINLYTERKIHFITETGLSLPRIMNLGLPQGSCLSPLLYIIYTRDIEYIFPRHTQLLQFADDICIYVKSNNIADNHHLLEESTSALVNWSLENGLDISESKSQVCTFTRSRYTPPDSIVLGKRKFPYKSSVRFLGMTLDKKLNWKEHINSISQRVEKSLNILKAFSTQKWGSDPNIVLYMYRTLIRPIFDYGSALYGNSSDTQLKKLDTIHNQSLRRCIGFLRSTPIDVIYAETVELPLSYRRKFLSDTLLTDLISKKSRCIDLISTLTVLSLTIRYWKYKKLPMLVESFSSHNDILDNVYCSSKLPYFQINYSTTLKPLEIQESNYHELHSDLRNRAFNWDLNSRWSSYTHIFTDGSKSNGVGCAVYCKNQNEFLQYKLPSTASIYTAELYAIERALFYCLHSDNTRFVIFSDSRSALEALKLNSTNSHHMNHIVAHILRTHSQLVEIGREIVLVWIKGHAGIEHNELVDGLAKEAVNEGETPNDFKIPKRDLRGYFKTKINEQWQQDFKNSTKGSFYKEIQPTLPKKPWFSEETNRQFIQTISRLRSNHALFPAHKHKMGLSETPLCEICETTADMQHICLECVMNWDKVNLLIDNLINLKIALPINWKHLLALNRNDVHRIIFQHVKAIQRKF